MTWIAFVRRLLGTVRSTGFERGLDAELRTTWSSKSTRTSVAAWIAGQPLDPQDRQGARDPVLDARCDLRSALVPAW
jgi:hypothetical protein